LEVGADSGVQPLEGEVLPDNAEGLPRDGEHLHAQAEHRDEFEAPDRTHDEHEHDDHPQAHDHDDHDHDEHDHEGEHEQDHASEAPAAVAAVGAEPFVATEAPPEPQDIAAFEALAPEPHAEALAEAVTAAVEPVDAVYAAGESAEAPHQETAEATTEAEAATED